MSVEALTDRPTNDPSINGVMKGLVYGGPGQRAWASKPKPTIRERGDAIVRITQSTICVLTITDGAGVDLAIEAVGTPAAFDTCQAIVGAGGRIANIGV